MDEGELVGHVGELVSFQRYESRYRGRLLEIRSKIQKGGGRDVHVIVELPATLLKISLSPDDVTLVEPNTRVPGVWSSAGVR